MATARKKTAAKKVAAKNAKKAVKKAAGKPARKPASEKPAAKPAPVTKVPKKKPAKKTAARKPGLGKTVNMGPLRGDNSFPPSNKPMPNNTSRAPVTKATKAHGSPANDSTRGPGGQGLQAKKQGAKGGSKDG